MVLVCPATVKDAVLGVIQIREERSDSMEFISIKEQSKKWKRDGTKSNNIWFDMDLQKYLNNNEFILKLRLGIKFRYW